MLYPTSESSDLTPEQCVALDDTLFESKPASYRRARIDMLLRDVAPIDYADGLPAEVLALGLDPKMLGSTAPTLDERELQRALDAFTLRHHLAESLVRLVRAVLTASDTPGASVWAVLASNYEKGAELAEALRKTESVAVPASLFLPAAGVAEFVAGPPSELEKAVRMHWRWVQRAMQLLVSDGLDTNAGNNKFKHGFAVRPLDDLRVEFSTVGPNPDGTMPLSAFEHSVPIIDAPAVEFLEQLPKRHSHAGSWEVTVLNLRPVPLLAEALALCTVLSSVFASAADRHFAGRDMARPKHPALMLGPAPEVFMRKPAGTTARR